MSNSILRINKLSVSYGQVSALKNINLIVNKGEIVVLIGANGAGKTSILETAIGKNKPEMGRIYFKGENICGHSIDRNVRKGLFLVQEGGGIFTSMNVLENLLLGAHHCLKDAKNKLEQVFEYFPVLAERQNQITGTLSGGERQMLAIARAIMSSPEMILIDEPSIGLAPIIVNEIFNIITDLNKQGYSILLSEQNVYKALKIAHRAYVIETGRIIKSGTSGELLNDEKIISAYLGV